MKILKCVAILCSLVTLAGCAAEAGPTADDDVAESTEALAASKVRLPVGDACRDVLAPLSLALADGSRGLAYTTGIAVSLTSETDTRLYTVSISGSGGEAAVRYEVELDNESASSCLLLAVTPEPNAQLQNDARSKATNRELRSPSAITVSPRGDDCTSTVRLLAQAAGVSAVGASFVKKIDVTLEGADESRGYSVHVDGKSFVANGRTFANDHDFELVVSNDSAFKCWVESVSHK